MDNKIIKQITARLERLERAVFDADNEATKKKTEQNLRAQLAVSIS